MRFTIRLISFAILVVAGFAGWLAWFAFSPVSLGKTPLEFEIRPGVGLRGAANEIASAGVEFQSWKFTWLGRFTGKAGEVKAGSYELAQGVTPWEILSRITRGDVSQAEIVFVEGKTFRELRAVLDANSNLRHDSRGLTDVEVLARIGATESHPEGLFFPDTYLFAKRSSDLDVLRRAYQAMRRRLSIEWENRDMSVPYGDPYQALIMASIVEKETGRPEDRPFVASVFTNRLRRGMLLQTDPSVIYGLGEAFDGNLRKRDLLTDGEYNTYTRPGLPPTPISMPGQASLHLVLHPPQSDKLYFVARGDGTSVFSRTLEEHNRAVAQHQKKNTGGN
ncbi:MAG: endolytic transglycosylase MltG [Gammaproteobacteria bacterium]|nr:endolytic transglycosylase MltG [Gammaproteobacteria bacterium]MBU1414780.1 endolytic transglycosylase MltG [Gammaproteobacteria bacterium]